MSTTRAPGMFDTGGLTKGDLLHDRMPLVISSTCHRLSIRS